LYNGEATKAAIDLFPVGRGQKKSHSRDRLLIYFSGHGKDEKDTGGKSFGYFIPYDGKLDSLLATASSNGLRRQVFPHAKG